MRYYLALLALCCGCAASSSEPMDGPNGPAVSVSCRPTINGCYEEAREQCPKGYQVADKTDMGFRGVLRARYILLVECK